MPLAAGFKLPIPSPLPEGVCPYLFSQWPESKRLKESKPTKAHVRQLLVDLNFEDKMPVGHRALLDIVMPPGNSAVSLSGQVNPLTPKSDQFQISPAASPEI